MAIRFECPNPNCGKIIRAPGDMVGQADRCPACGTPIVIPPPSDGQFSRADGAYIKAIKFVHDRALMESLRGEHPARCLECGHQVAPNARSCGHCGRANPLLPDPKGLPAAIRRQKAYAVRVEGGLASDCLNAAGHALRNLPAAFLLAACFTGAYALLRILIHFAWPLLDQGGRRWLLVAGLAPFLLLAGWTLRVHGRTVMQGLSASVRPKRGSPAGIAAILRSALHALGIGLVYVLPLVTVPLLPIGLIGCAYMKDSRALNVAWAARSAARAPEGLAALWLLLLLWGGIAALVVLGITVPLAGLARAPAVCAAGPMPVVPLIIDIIATWLGALAGFILLTIPFRCIGALGRHHPAILDGPPSRSPLIVAGSVVGGAALSAITLGTILLPIARRWGL